MSEWKEVKLGDVCDVITKGTTPSNIGDSFVDEGIKFIRSEMLGRDKYINNSGFLFISEETHQRLRRSQLKEKDILFSMAGVYLGKTAILRKEDVPSNTNQAVAIIRVNGTKADVEYIYYCLNHPHIVKTVNASCAQSAQPNINLKQIGEISFLTPPLGIQQRIASILSSLDDKIAVNRRICENLEAQAQALFKNWFVDFAPFKNGKFVESELGMIPEGWRVGTLSDLGEIVGGATPSKAESSYFTDKGIPWLTPKDLSNDLKKFTSRGEIDITEDGYNSCSAKIMPRGSVLFSSRAPIGYLTIAKNSICTNQGFKSVVPKYAGTAYIYYLLKLNTKRIESMSTGTTFKEASGALMKSLAVVLPPKSILDAFESKVLDIFNEQEILETESHRLTTLRDTLLPKLMSGEIKI